MFLHITDKKDEHLDSKPSDFRAEIFYKHGSIFKIYWWYQISNDLVKYFKSILLSFKYIKHSCLQVLSNPADLQKNQRNVCRLVFDCSV